MSNIGDQIRMSVLADRLQGQGITGCAFSNEKEIDEAYQHYMEMNFGNMHLIEKEEPKMPSRTYIEMALKLNFQGRYPLPRQTVINFAKVEFELHGKPELIEEIVHNRVKTVKFIRDSGMYAHLTRYHYTMIDYTMACKLLCMGCYITMPFRAGKDWFSKAITNMWYGDMMEKEFVNIRPMTADKLEGIDKDKIAMADNFLAKEDK